MSDDPVEIRLERARHQGRESFHAGDPRTDSPYAPHTDEHRVWLDAWDAAHDLREAIGELLRRQA
jgi:ribosome modulation factor